MSDWTLSEFIDALGQLEHEEGCHKCAGPSDEGMDNLVEAAIDLLWPKASLLLRGDDWVLQRSKHKWKDVMEDILSQDYDD